MLLFFSRIEFNFNILIGEKKEINAAYKPRYQFLVCYTDALKDFVAQLEAKEQKLKKKQQQQQQQPLALSPSNQCQDKENRPEAVAQATSLNTTTTKNGVEMSTATHQHHQTPTNKSYTVGGKRLTLDDVRALAKKAYSDEQEQVLRERDAYSKQLFERLDSPECKVGAHTCNNMYTDQLNRLIY